MRQIFSAYDHNSERFDRSRDLLYRHGSREVGLRFLKHAPKGGVTFLSTWMVCEFPVLIVPLRNLS